MNLETMNGIIDFYEEFSVNRYYLRKLAHFVQVFAVIDNGLFTHGNYTIVGTLPEGFRPKMLVSMPITSSRSVYGAQAFAEIMTDGIFRIYQYGDTDAMWVNINICYFI